MRDIIEINRKAKAHALGGAKIPHGISNPVIREHRGAYTICYFVYTLTHDQMKSKQYPRPSEWLAVDIKEGDLIARISCADEDFSQEPAGKVYSIDRTGCVEPTETYYKVLDTLFDTARASIVFSGEPDMRSYEAYFDKMLAITPKAYRVFYRELTSLV